MAYRASFKHHDGQGFGYHAVVKYAGRKVAWTCPHLHPFARTSAMSYGQQSAVACAEAFIRAVDAQKPLAGSGSGAATEEAGG